MPALALAAALSACTGQADAPGRAEPAPVLLRYRFQPGRVLRYESSTTERGANETTITMRTRWETQRRQGDAAEILVAVERYDQVVSPREALDAETATLNRELAGARFRVRVSDDGRSVEHLGAEGVPEVSPARVEALRVTLTNHLLRLPRSRVRLGQRWTVETASGAPDAGASAAGSRSRWRVLAVLPEARRLRVELFCVSSTEPEPMKIGSGSVRAFSEFRYRYVFDAAAGLLEEIESNGSTTMRLEGLPDTSVSAEPIEYQGRLRLLARP
jgi:hypothetical protein